MNISDQLIDSRIKLDRNNLFLVAKKHLSDGEFSHALSKFLQCISGLTMTSDFLYLPQCLHSIAELLFRKEEYDAALQFIQAEKYYYETALVDAAQLKSTVKNESGVTNLATAEEYENIAQFCLDKNHPELSLEYQGKAAKIYKQLLGEESYKTLKCLDVFAVMYSEVGKIQYKGSIDKMKSGEMNCLSDMVISNKIESDITNSADYIMSHKSKQDDSIISEPDVVPSIDTFKDKKDISVSYSNVQNLKNYFSGGHLTKTMFSIIFLITTFSSIIFFRI